MQYKDYGLGTVTSNDNDASIGSIGTNNATTMHNYRMLNDKEYADAQHLLEWQAVQGGGLQDQSLVMAAGIQGAVGGGLGKLVQYGEPTASMLGRVVKSVSNKDPLRLVAAPTRSELKKAATGDGEAVDKLLWKSTGNAVKLDSIINN